VDAINNTILKILFTLPHDCGTLIKKMHYQLLINHRIAVCFIFIPSKRRLLDVQQKRFVTCFAKTTIQSQPKG